MIKQFLSQLTPSDIIQIFGITFSLLTSVVAIAISVITLRQNSKMIEESSRAYLSIYGVSAYVDAPDYYLILKNFGQTSATILSFTYDFDLANCTVKRASREPFENIEGTTIVPGQALKAIIDFNKATEKVNYINFHITYISGKKKYEEDFCVNLLGNLGNYVEHHTPANKDLKTISETLQEINLRQL